VKKKIQKQATSSTIEASYSVAAADTDPESVSATVTEKLFRQRT